MRRIDELIVPRGIDRKTVTLIAKGTETQARAISLEKSKVILKSEIHEIRESRIVAGNPIDPFPLNIIQWSQLQVFHISQRGVTDNGSAAQFYPARLSG
jgi:hypothetical protein